MGDYEALMQAIAKMRPAEGIAYLIINAEFTVEELDSLEQMLKWLKGKRVIST